jgi:hypothetical protein
MADLPPVKVRVEGPTISEFVVSITASSEGLFALTSYGKMWRFERLGYVDHEWHAMTLPPLKGTD